MGLPSDHHIAGGTFTCRTLAIKISSSGRIRPVDTMNVYVMLSLKIASSSALSAIIPSVKRSR